MRLLNTTPVAPTCGPTGCTTVTSSFSTACAPDSERREVPPASVRLEYVYDDGEVAGERVLEHEEFEAASQRFPELSATLERIDGDIDPDWAGNLSATVVCEDGSQATAEWGGEAWRWVDWSPPGKPKLG